MMFKKKEKKIAVEENAFSYDDFNNDNIEKNNEAVNNNVHENLAKNESGEKKIYDPEKKIIRTVKTNYSRDEEKRKKEERDTIIGNIFMFILVIAVLIWFFFFRGNN